MNTSVRAVLLTLAMLALGSCSSSDDSATLLAITLSPSFPDGLPIGYRQQMMATGEFDDGAFRDLTDSVVWSSSSAAISIDSSGLVTGESAGMSTISAAREGIEGSIDLTAFEGLVTQMLIEPTAVGAQTSGRTLEFTATATFTGGVSDFDLDVTRDAVWESTRLNVLENRGNGVFRTRDNGGSTVTATDAPSGVVSNSVSVTVHDR